MQVQTQLHHFLWDFTDKLFNLSEPLFPHPQHGKDNLDFGSTAPGTPAPAGSVPATWPSQRLQTGGSGGTRGRAGCRPLTSNKERAQEAPPLLDSGQRPLGLQLLSELSLL